MTFTPPGVNQSAGFGPGIHTACILDRFTMARPSKDGKYQVAYVAAYRDTETRQEIEDWIKFDGSKKDYYSGLRVERLHAILGADLPPDGQHPDFKHLEELSDGVFFTVEIEETQSNGRTYHNIKDVRANDENGVAASF